MCGGIILILNLIIITVVIKKKLSNPLVQLDPRELSWVRLNPVMGWVGYFLINHDRFN